MTKWTPNPRGNYYERKAYRELRAPEIAAEKAAKDADAMTCQCCARRIFAQSGSIAHHGYERPGTGWQTASCIGAKEMPWEVSRDALGKLIDRLGDSIKHTKKHIADLQAETVKVPYTYQTHERTSSRYGAPRVSRTEMFTRAEFDAALARLDALFAPILAAGSVYGMPYRDACKALSPLDSALWNAMRSTSRKITFDSLKEGAIANAQSELGQLQVFKRESEERFASWKQTHKGFDKKTKTWEPL